MEIKVTNDEITSGSLFLNRYTYICWGEGGLCSVPVPVPSGREWIVPVNSKGGLEATVPVNSKGGLEATVLSNMAFGHGCLVKIKRLLKMEEKGF